MNDVVFVVALHVVGATFVAATGATRSAVGTAALGLPTGAFLYVWVGVTLLALRIPFSVEVGVATTAAVAAGAAILWRRDRPDVGRTLMAMAGGAVLLAVLAAAVPWDDVVRLTPDSIDHLAAGSVLERDGDVEAIPDTALEKRSVAVGLLQAGNGRDLVRGAVLPLVGLTGVATLGWLAYAWTTRRRILLAAGAVAVVAATHHADFQLLYLNGHAPYAVALLVFAACSWRAAVTGDERLARLALAPMALLLVSRPEGPLVTALFAVPLLASAVPTFRQRASLAVAMAVVTVTWHGAGLALWLDDGFASETVLAAFAVALGAGALLALPHRLAKWAPAALVAALAVGVLVATAADTGLMRRTVASAADNLWLEGKGYWGALMWVLPPLVVAALALSRPPFRAFWVTALAGFPLLWLLLAPLREGAYRVGFGDSGNRILFHVVLPALFAVVMAAGSEDATPAPETT